MRKVLFFIKIYRPELFVKLFFANIKQRKYDQLENYLKPNFKQDLQNIIFEKKLLLRLEFAYFRQSKIQNWA